MAGSTVSRRVSEFFGVALFAAALIWLIALATYEPTDPVWFFSAGSGAQPVNFAGRVGAFLAELSFQLLGYASYLIPAAMVILGWHYFWCRTLDAQYTKLVGAGLLFGCVSSLLSLAFGSVDVDGKPFRAGGYLGEWLASWMAEYLNRTGSIIVILTLLFLAIVLSTQFSLGRMFSSATAVSRSGGLADVRRAAGLARRTPPQRVSGRRCSPSKPRRPRSPRLSSPRPKEPAEIPSRPSRCSRSRQTTGRRTPAARDGEAAEDDRKSAAAVARSGAATAAPQRRVHDSAAVAARRAENRAQDRRARAHGRRASARGKMPRVRRRGRRRADSSRPGGHDIRVQAGRRREIRKDHRASPTISASRCRPNRCSSIAFPGNRPSASRFRITHASRSRSASCCSRRCTSARHRS